MKNWGWASVVQWEAEWCGFILEGRMTIDFCIGLYTGVYEILAFESPMSLGMAAKISLLLPVSDNLKAGYG